MRLWQQLVRKLHVCKKTTSTDQPKTPISQGRLKSVVWAWLLHYLVWSPVQCEVEGTTQDDPQAVEPLLMRRALLLMEVWPAPSGRRASHSSALRAELVSSLGADEGEVGS